MRYDDFRIRRSSDRRDEENMNKAKVIAVAGPTASGKTSLAVELALRLDGEIISCDSMQVYKEMDIGTAKVSAEEARGVPHHLTSIISCGESFSCSDYVSLAENAADDIISRNKTPIFCGGTGLYLDSVLKGTRLSDAGIDREYRAALMKKSPDELYAQLLSVDPEAAGKIHRNNVRRVIRALEIYHVTGKTKTVWDRESRENGDKYDATVIGLDYHDREILYRRIDKRVDIMMDRGLLDEVKRLDTPCFRASTASQAIGYKELLSYIDGVCTLSEAVEEIKKSSRAYAKRQLTWFRRNPEINWIYPDKCPEGQDNFEFIVNSAINIININ